jgi:uncharacterized protein
MIGGIDYGSKLSGCTAFAVELPEAIIVHSSEKDKDADKWLQQTIHRYPIKHLYIDAPLSLPGAYQKINDDFMYRQCDRITKAMSPMFLGGLTARAMQLAHTLKRYQIQCWETYPGQTIFRLTMQDHYNKKASPHPLLVQELEDIFNKPLQFEKPDFRIHEIDALLALYAGKLHQKGIASVVGRPEEGQIIY